MNEDHLSSSEHHLKERPDKVQDIGAYTNDFFSFRNVLISAIVLGGVILLLSLLR